MARSVNEKDHKAKRDAILDAVQQLVETKGYEQTAIQDILNALHISKGAFYHYFDSKPALLLALVQRRGDALEQVVLPIVENPQLSPVDKLARFFAAQDQFKRDRRDFVLDLTRNWYADENAVLRHKLSTESRRRTAPWLARIIAEGVAEGAFTTTYPDQAAVILTSIIDGLGQTIAELLPADGRLGDVTPILEATEAVGEAIERVLGARPGVLSGPWREAVSGW